MGFIFLILPISIFISYQNCYIMNKLTQRLGLFLLFSITMNALGQTLTISSSGEDGSSGSNWTLVGNTLNVSGTANIRASVIQDHLLNTGPLTIVMNSVLSVVVDEAINVATGGNAFNLGTEGNEANFQISQSISVNGPLSLYAGSINVIADLTSTASGAGMLLKTFEHLPGANATDGFLILGSGVDLTTDGGDIILWANATNRTAAFGQANNEIVLAGSNTLATSGGKIVLAGGLDDGSNGGTAADGIPDGYAYRGGYAGEAVDIRSNITLDSDGGEIIIRGEQNGSAEGVGSDNTLTISNAGPITILGKNTTNISVRLGISNITSTVANAPVSILGTTHLRNGGLISITTQEGDVILAANIDDATDNETTTNGYINLRSGLSITTNGGDITIGGGNANGTDYAFGSSAEDYTEGVRLDFNTTLNSGNGNISIKGKSYNKGVRVGWGAAGVGFYGVANGSINSGTGTILIDGYSQTSVSDFNAGILFSNNTPFTIQSANTTSDAIILNGFAAGTSGEAFGIETEGSSTLNLLATASGGGITVNTGNSIANYYDAVFRGPTNILAVDGPISIKGGQLGGVANGRFYTANTLNLGSKAATDITASSSDLLIEFDRLEFVSTKPQIATTGSVTWQSTSASFGATQVTNDFQWNQNSQTMSSLTIGKAGNTAAITIAGATSIAGPISVYGGDIAINQNLNTTAGGANGDVTLTGSGNITLAESRTITTDGGDVTFRADSDDNRVGGIRIGSDFAGVFTTAITTNGGDIILSGGSDPLTGYAHYDGGLGAAFSTYHYAIGVFGATLNAGGSSDGGNILIRGSGGNTFNGLLWTVNIGGQYGANTKLVTNGTGTISIVGDGSEAPANPTANNSRNSWATIIPGTVETESGNITLIGLANVARSNARGFSISGSIQSASGTISLEDRTPNTANANYTGPFISGAQFGKGSLSASSSNVSLVADKFQFNNNVAINTSGTVAISSYGDSFLGALSFPISNLSLDAAISGLTLGKASNTAAMTIAGATTIAGPITVYGGNIAINAATTATSSDINLHASGAVTQSAALTANRLALNGTGTFTLQNAANNVAIIAGGDNTTRLGNVAYRDADALEIGSVNPDGIFSSGTVLIETENGDITLSQNINTTSTSTNAIIVNAGRASSPGTIGGGNIIVSSPAPTLTMGTGGIAKLFSGIESSSTGLTDLAGGSANTRSPFDETSTISPALAADNTYAIYRVAAGAGNLTIVSSGGTSVGNGWIYDNGVITTISSPVNINASTVVGYLATGDLTIEAANITVNANVTSTTANALVLKATGQINAATNVQLISNGGDIVFWADSDEQNGGRIYLNTGVDFDTRTNADRTAGNTTTATGGGKIILAGGLDTNADGIPDGYATSRETTVAGIQFGSVTSSHYNIGSSLDFTFYSGGGDIVLRGKGIGLSGSNQGAERRNGIKIFYPYDINSGSGAVSISAVAEDAGTNGMYLYFSNSRIVSNASSGTAISIQASSNDNNAWYDTGYYSRGYYATGGGGIQFIVEEGINLRGSEILAAGGEIAISASSGSIFLGPGVNFQTSNTTLGSKSGSPYVSASSADIRLVARAVNFNSTSDHVIRTTGKLTVEPFADDFSSSPTLNWNLQNTLSGITVGKASSADGTNDVDVTLSTAASVNGPISVYGRSITLNQNINTTGGELDGDVAIIGSGAITLAGSRTITTNGSDVTLISNNGLSSGGGILLGTGAGITSTGAAGSGNISLGTAGNYAIGNVSFLDNGNLFYGGVLLQSTNTLNAGTGTIGVYGKATGTTRTFGIYANGSTLTGGDVTLIGEGSAANTSAGDAGISIIGTSNITASGGLTVNGTSLGTNTSSFNRGINMFSAATPVTMLKTTGTDAMTITGVSGGGASSSTLGIYGVGAHIQATGGGDISLNGSNNSTGQSGTGVYLLAENTRTVMISASGAGNINITGTGSLTGTNNANGVWIRGNYSTASVTTESGSINITGTKGSGTNAYGIIVATQVVAGYPTPLSLIGGASQTGAISINADEVRFMSTNGAANNQINTSGTVTFAPVSTSFSAAQTFPYSDVAIDSRMGGLTIGKEGNTANVTISSAQTIAGPITLYGGDLAINAALTATNDDINLHASGNVTQSSALTADGLGLHGSGTFTLTNASNNVVTIAGGDATTKLGSLSFVDAADGLTIGSVNPDGITATGPILIETLEGDITLSENVATDDTTTDAIIINAGKNANAGTAAGGDIIVSGTPTLSFGNGGMAKLFSGYASAPLTTLAGTGNSRLGVDENSSFSPALEANNTYALYRMNESNITVVASGGQSPTISNGVLRIDGTQDVNLSVITNYLQSNANLTIEATGNVIFNTALNATGTLSIVADADGNASGDISFNEDVTAAALSLRGKNTVVAAGKHVNVGGNLENHTDLTLDSRSNAFSSLRVSGAVSGTGDLTYSRYVNITPSNDLIAAPFAGMSFSNMINNSNSNTLLSGSIGGQSGFYLFGPHNEQSNSYEMYNITTNAATTLTSGKGYRAGSIDGGNLNFTVPANGYNTLSNNVTIGITHTGEGWNLVGNPYPTYLTLSQVLSENANNLYGNEFNAFYTYNGDATNPWTIYNSSNSTDIKIAPGQAFFVRAADGGATFSFTPSMQSNTGGDDFIAGRNAAETSVYRAGIELSSSVGSYTTDVYFHPNGSNGLDVGYDAASWQGSAPDYGVYSHLVSDNQGLPIAIQTLHSDALEQDSTVIPLGVEASSGYTLTLGLTDNSYLPESAIVYLEDRNLGSFTNLRTGSYSVSSGNGISGTGRFFIHVGNDATLSNPGEVYSGVQVYSPMGSGVLVVTGVNEPGMRLRLYDIQGRLLLDQGLSAVSMQELPVGTLSTAAVIARLEGAQGSRSVKLIINQK
jgi:hypothetical protein